MNNISDNIIENKSVCSIIIDPVRILNITKHVCIECYSRKTLSIHPVCSEIDNYHSVSHKQWHIMIYLFITGYLEINNRFGLVSFMVFNATFNDISVILWRSVLLMEETGVPGENHQSVASHWQALSHNVVSSAPSPDRDSNS